jgi:hypothetical protein
MKRTLLFFSISLLLILHAGINARGQSASSTERTLSQTLMDFSGRNQNNSILLSWTSLISSENLSFYIQRSKDAAEWVDIGKVNGSTAQPGLFSYTDNKPNDATVYYRLKMEKGGSIEYSSMISVKFSEINKTILFPNPTKNVIYIKSEEAQYQDLIDLEVYNILGEKVYASKMERGDIQKVDMTNYNNGYYCIKIGSRAYKVLKE